MTTPHTVADLWALYETNVLPKSAGANQRTETRRAFYAAVHAIIENCSWMSDNMTEADAAEHLGFMSNECWEFAAAVKRGNA